MKKILHVISHSHWDREWYMSFEQHRMRLVELMDTLIETMEREEEYKYFHLDGQTIVIDDYLEIRPQMRERLFKLIHDGRIQVGPWYILQDEFLTSGEANIRNMMEGLRFCKENDIEPVMTGYMPDAFANISQMPQLLRGFGIDNAVFGRGIDEVFADNKPSDASNSGKELVWYGADGSKIMGIMFSKWYNNANELPVEESEVKLVYRNLIDNISAYMQTPHLLAMNGCDHQPVQCDLPVSIAKANELLGDDVEIRHSNFKDFIESIRPYSDSFKRVDGELIGQHTSGNGQLVGTASAHIPNKQKNHKVQNVLTQKSEPISVMSDILGDPYRDDMMRYAWKKLMQCHPHDSICCCSCDEVTRELSVRLDKAGQSADFISAEAAEFLAKNLDTSAVTGKTAIVVIHTDPKHTAKVVDNGVGAEASVCNVICSGFKYGMVISRSSIFTLNDLDLSGNTDAAIYSWGSHVTCQNVKHGEAPLFIFDEGIGVYYIVDEPNVVLGDFKGNRVYVEEKPVALRDMGIPENPRSLSAEDWALVDDFGAVGDGKTDSTAAIQAAMNSGKSVIMFGSGHYLVSGEITIPATVQTVDFMFCDFFASDELVNARGGALFNICEDSDEMLFMENLYTFEQFYGHVRLIKHAAKRDLVMSDIHTQASSTYFNTVSGSKVYMDNCAATTGTYTCNAILERPGLPPYYSYVIPYEFHGQTVYGRQVNPERADVEMLNDASNILMDGFKVEGPGAVVKTISGGTSELHVVSCGIGYRNAPNALFITEYARTKVVGARIFGCDPKLDHEWMIEQHDGGMVQFVHKDDLPDQGTQHKRYINYYDSNELGKLR